MNTENLTFVSDRFLYWLACEAGLPHVDVEEDEYPELYFPGMDVNNSAEVKERVIRPFIVPWFRLWDEASQRVITSSLQYYLNQEKPLAQSQDQDLFDRVIAAANIMFEPPTPPRLFFIWIWEELVGSEDYHLDSMSDFVVDEDREWWLTLRSDDRPLA
jgi:hypothetical protein